MWRFCNAVPYVSPIEEPSASFTAALTFINSDGSFLRAKQEWTAMDPSMKSLDQKILEDAVRIVEEAAKLKASLRILGALAIRIHCEEFIELQRKLKRLGSEDRNFTDIDLIGYGKERSKVRTLMEDILGYKYSQQFILMHGKERLIYYHPEDLYHVDVFFDKLRFSHDIDFGSSPEKGRLKLDFPTIPLADLLLEKLQIHEINEKDIKDIMLLLRAHTVGYEDQRETVNVKHVAQILAED